MSFVCILAGSKPRRSRSHPHLAPQTIGPHPPPTNLAHDVVTSESATSKRNPYDNVKLWLFFVSHTVDTFNGDSVQGWAQYLEGEPQNMVTTLAFARKPLDFQKETAEQISNEVALVAVVEYVKDDAVLKLTTLKAYEKTEEGVSRNSLYFVHNVGPQSS